jgi:hypothetical protein
MRAGVQVALAERIARGSLQIEAHYLRKGGDTAAAATVRARVNNGVAKVLLNSLVDHFLNPKDRTPLAESRKRDGLDDGPALP